MLMIPRVLIHCGHTDCLEFIIVDGHGDTSELIYRCDEHSSNYEVNTMLYGRLHSSDVVSIEDLSEQDARQIFGNPIYEAWVKAKDEEEVDQLTVIDVDRKNKTITLG